MEKWQLRKDKPAIFQFTNQLETRGPSCLDINTVLRVVPKVLSSGWVEMAELVEITGVPARDLLCEFWNISRKWHDGSPYFAHLLVFGYPAGEKSLCLKTWGEADSKAPHSEYLASHVQFVPAGWGLTVMKGVEKKREEARHIQETLRWAK